MIFFQAADIWALKINVLLNRKTTNTCFNSIVQRNDFTVLEIAQSQRAPRVQSVSLLTIAFQDQLVTQCDHHN